MSALSLILLIVGGVIAFFAVLVATLVTVNTLTQLSVYAYKRLTGAKQVHGEGMALTS
jgi:hypothetical protein